MHRYKSVAADSPHVTNYSKNIFYRAIYRRRAAAMTIIKGTWLNGISVASLCIGNNTTELTLPRCFW
jgi:hypothetical protein